MIQFIKYVIIGLFNTLHHWLWFFLFLYYGDVDAAVSNTIAFILSASISYLLNSKITFKKNVNIKSFILFFTFMALLSYITGYLTLQFNIYEYFIPIIFSIVSLIIGFIYSKVIVFKGN